MDQPLLLLQKRVLPLSGKVGFFFVIFKPSQATGFYSLKLSLSAVVIWVPLLHAEACLEAVRGMLVVG